MRCLGIDFGAKRVGLSHGDEVGVATPLPALVGVGPTERVARIGELVKQRRITDLVVGYPYNMDGTAGFKAKEVDAFVTELKNAFGLPVHLVDETLTSYAAEESIAPKSRRQVRSSGLVDSRAACLILQDFLDHRQTP
ncbi:MAG TPA: Holliday junction resolvase RuvX [Candidatus Didemnitutus sp.]|nr:Holliday junction resolvase RuvX [Candidatus Didemnitutus sp.]